MPEPDLKKAIRALEVCTSGVQSDLDCTDCPYHDDCENHPMRPMMEMLKDTLALLKAQEQEISRLKHHVDCDAAEKLPSGCVGYGRGFNDDEPCETCKACEKYNGYGEE